MSIATEIQRIQQAKADIKTAIEAKGVTVPSSATIDTYDDYVSQISTGYEMPSNLSEWVYDSNGFPTRVTIKNANYAIGIKTIGSLKHVTFLGGSLSYQYMQNCTNLLSVTISGNATAGGWYIFDGCTSLTSVTITSDSATSIGGSAFANCSSLTSLTITSTTPPTLGNNALQNTSSNLAIYVPSGSVSDYQSASGWSDYASIIQAIPNS